MSHISPIQQRLRIVYGKSGPLKYTSNLDVAKIWERVLRRADLPILYTQGFNTRPRIQLASPLPLGITSECEILDVALRERIDLNEASLIQQIESVSPTGLSVEQIDEIEVTAPAMQALVRSAEYRIRFEDGIPEEALQEIVTQTLAQEEILREKVHKKGRKKGRKTTYDIRPHIHNLHIDEQGDLIAHLAVGEQGNLRPDHLLQLMGLEDQFYTVHRYQIHSEETK